MGPEYAFKLLLILYVKSVHRKKRYRTREKDCNDGDQYSNGYNQINTHNICVIWHKIYLLIYSCTLYAKMYNIIYISYFIGRL